MSSASAPELRLLRAVGRTLLLPQWRLSLVLAGLGWGWIVLELRGLEMARICGALLRPDAQWSVFLLYNPPSALLADWLAMLLAMLPPMLVVPLMPIWRGALRRNRVKLVAAYVFGYLGIWMMALPLAVAVFALAAPSAWALLVGGVMVWQFSPWRQVCLNSCHRQPPLRAFGFEAYFDALALGASTGRWCVLTCLPAMIAAMVVPAPHIVAMFAVALGLTAERFLPPRSPRWFAILGRDPQPRFKTY